MDVNVAKSQRFPHYLSLPFWQYKSQCAFTRFFLLLQLQTSMLKNWKTLHCDAITVINLCFSRRTVFIFMYTWNDCNHEIKMYTTSAARARWISRWIVSRDSSYLRIVLFMCAHHRNTKQDICYMKSESEFIDFECVAVSKVNASLVGWPMTVTESSDCYHPLVYLTLKSKWKWKSTWGPMDIMVFCVLFVFVLHHG